MTTISMPSLMTVSAITFSGFPGSIRALTDQASGRQLGLRPLQCPFGGICGFADRQGDEGDIAIERSVRNFVDRLQRTGAAINGDERLLDRPKRPRGDHNRAFGGTNDPLEVRSEMELREIRCFASFPNNDKSGLGLALLQGRDQIAVAQGDGHIADAGTLQADCRVLEHQARLSLQQLCALESSSANSSRSLRRAPATMRPERSEAIASRRPSTCSNSTGRPARVATQAA